MARISNEDRIRLAQKMGAAHYAAKMKSENAAQPEATCRYQDAGSGCRCRNVVVGQSAFCVEHGEDVSPLALIAGSMPSTSRYKHRGAKRG